MPKLDRRIYQPLRGASRDIKAQGSVAGPSLLCEFACHCGFGLRDPRRLEEEKLSERDGGAQIAYLRPAWPVGS